MWVKGSNDKYLNLNAVVTIEFDKKKNITVAKGNNYRFDLGNGNIVDKVIEAIKKYDVNDVIDKNQL